MVGCYLINPDSIIKREGYRFVTDSLLSQLVRNVSFWELKALLIVRKDQKALFLKNVFNKLNLPVLSMLGWVDCFIDRFKLKFKYYFLSVVGTKPTIPTGPGNICLKFWVNFVK